MAKTLTKDINFAIVLRVMGWLLLIEALFMAMPIGVALYYGEHESMWAFLYASLTTIGVGLMMTFGIKPASTSMRKREGLLLTAFVWIFFSAFGMLPFLYNGTIVRISDAFFETMAGFTTTGASVLSNLDTLPRSILFWRSLMQWIGGMGIILFTLAVLPMLNYKGGIALFNAEVTGITHERLRPRVSQTAKDLWLIYITLTGILAALLYSAMGGFDAVCHAMSTMSTGGLSTHDDGIAYWHSPYITTVVLCFMFLGGVNFTLLYYLTHGKFRRLMASDTFGWYCLVAITTTVLITLSLWHSGLGEDFLDRLLTAAFDTVAAITSTGYTSEHYLYRDSFATLLIMIVMFFGGMAGSTSGGAKIDRFMVLLKNTRNELYRVLHPNTVTAVRIDGKPLHYQTVAKVIAFLSIYLLVVMVVAIALTMMDVPIFDALYTSVSAISNQGVGYGVTAQSGSYALLPDGAKWLLSFEMAVGRLELFTMLVLFTPPFWIKD